MAPARTNEILLYVKSHKAVTSFYRPRSTAMDVMGDPHAKAADSDATDTSDEMTDAEGAYMLSDEQARCVSLAEEVALRRGYHLKIIDVARTNLVTKLLDSHLSGATTFPVLVVPSSGHRLIGPSAFSELSLLALLPAEMKNRRAFTYLKVDAVDLDEVRQNLLNLPEVKEVHVITGDWDLFLVLEFAGSGEITKRQVLDFIIGLKKRVPGVSDTSSFIPELSVTKFPL